MLHRRYLRECQKGGAGVGTGAASPNGVTLVEATLGARFLAESPERLIGDQACDSDPLDQRLAERGIERIAPRQPEESQDAGRTTTPLP